MEIEERKNDPLAPQELVQTMEPHTVHLEKVGELQDNSAVNEKQAKILQTPVLTAANAAVKLKLARDAYRAKWRYKDTYKADKWAHKDKVKQMRKDRRDLVASRKAANKAAKEAKRQAQKKAKEEKRNGKGTACTSSPKSAGTAQHERSE